MTLTHALSNAYSGLANSGYRADITAGNISNASTPGYVRREVINAENVVGNRGNGVRIAGVERHQDQGLSRLRRSADATFGRSNILSEAYNQLNRELGVPGDGYGLFAAFEGLESSLRDLSGTPESPALQNALLSASNDIVNQFNDLSRITTQMQHSADDNIAKSVDIVNQSLHRLKQLNGEIGGANEQSGETAALEDERQQLIDKISEIIPVRDIPRENGQIDIMTDAGVFLLSGNVNALSFTRANAIPIGSSYLSGNGNLSGLFVGDQELTPGSMSSFATNSGALAGYFSVRDTIAPKFSNQIDSLASDLISRLSDDALDPSKAVGAPGIFTDNGNALDTPSPAGLAGRIQVNAAVDPAQGGLVSRFRDGLGSTTTGASGDAGLINKILDALSASAPAPTQSGLAGDLSSVELAAGLSSLIGENSIRHNALSTSALTRSNALYDSEIQISGVDVDREMQSLLLIEQSYAANARVIQTVGDMLDRLLQL